MGKLLENQEGKVYGQVLVLLDLGVQLLPSGIKKQRQVLGKCLNCSSDSKVYILNLLRTGGTKSCGCLQTQNRFDVNKTHGLSKTRQYHIWCNFVARCKNEKNKSYCDYGARGISVCEKWLTFDGFWEDMSEGYTDKLELDRIDVNGNYCKENCRWTDKSEQNYNQRMRVANTSGRTGVYYRKDSGKWRALISKDGKMIQLGHYDTYVEAVKAREQAELEHFGYNKE